MGTDSNLTEGIGSFNGTNLGGEIELLPGARLPASGAGDRDVGTLGAGADLVGTLGAAVVVLEGAAEAILGAGAAADATLGAGAEATLGAAGAAAGAAALGSSSSGVGEPIVIKEGACLGNLEASGPGGNVGAGDEGTEGFGDSATCAEESWDWKAWL